MFSDLLVSNFVKSCVNIGLDHSGLMYSVQCTMYPTAHRVLSREKGLAFLMLIALFIISPNLFYLYVM